MKQGTKRIQLWCEYCDKSLVTPGTKCKVCKKRAERKLEKLDLKKLISEAELN